MDFVFDKHTPVPAHAQIQEQIKLALLLGRLRPGDTLPSIRDVEKQVGISRNLVWKAYLELQASGILNLRHGGSARRFPASLLPSCGRLAYPQRASPAICTSTLGTM